MSARVTFPSRYIGWIAALLCAATAGCSSSYSKLVREDSLPDLHAAKAATLSHGNKTVMAPSQGAAGPGLKLAVHELDTKHSDRILVLLHGVFADHETWRFVAGDLARDHGVWLVDLPGCGDSETPGSNRAETYTIPDTAERTLQALRHCLREVPDSSRLDIVGHSFGAAVVLRMFGDGVLRVKYADVLRRMDRLVLISPLDIAMNSPAVVYRGVAEASSLKVWLANVSGVLKSRVAQATLASVADPSRALREEADKKIEILKHRGRRGALQGMLQKAVPWTEGLRPDWPKIEPDELGYANVDRECLIIVGMRDEALPAAMSYKVAVQLPRAALVPLKGVMHSPHIEEHERVATLIREFVTVGRVEGDVLRRGPSRP